MLAGIVQDDLMARIGPEAYEKALESDGVRPMDFTGRKSIVLSNLRDIGFDQPIEENGKDFDANAYIKAKAVFDFCKRGVFSDDSGLVVDALGGAPGIYSA
ncbi:unnamed protein product, partial [Cyprideis torosa]